MLMSSTVAIVVTANGRMFLEANLPSLQMQSLRFDRIIVVDNGSTDGTREFCQKLMGVQLLSLPKNLGFAAGANHGLMSVLSDRSLKQVALINNDVRLHKEWHAQADQILWKCSKCGSVATCLLKAHNPERVDTAGITWLAPGFPENYMAGLPAPSAVEQPRAILGACAGAALFKAEFFLSVGLFDESLFAYQEDVDLALRGADAGWQCFFAPAAVGWHSGFGSNSRFPLGGSWADFFNARNRLAVLIQSLPDHDWRFHWRNILWQELARTARSIPEGRGLAVVVGLAHSICWVPGRWQRRRERSRLRRHVDQTLRNRKSKAGWSRLSVGLIIKDVMQTLPTALSSIPCDAELLVADGGSMDLSPLLARSCGATVVYQDPARLAEAGGNFDVARNQLAALASREWVLFLDADEELTDALCEEIGKAVNSETAHNAYEIPRKNLFWGRVVRLLGGDFQVRLMRVGCCEWTGTALHQHPKVDGPLGRLKSCLIHHNITRWKDVFGKFQRYLPLEFQNRSGPKSLYETMALPWWYFRFFYLQQEAWRDGGMGLLVSMIFTLYHSLADWGAGLRRGTQKRRRQP